MKIENWQCNYTEPNRYYKIGVADTVLDFCKTNDRRQLKIVDVGCSRGVAGRDLKSWLSSNGINCSIKGIDLDPDVQEEVKRNLDEFELGDIRNVASLITREGIADVVICCHIAINLPAKRESEIIGASLRLVKTDGILVTNTSCFERASDTQVVKEMFYQIPVRSLRLRFRGFMKERNLRQVQVRKRKLKVLYDPDQSIQYSKKIIEGWNKLNPLDKFTLNFEIYAKILNVRLQEWTKSVWKRASQLLVD